MSGQGKADVHYVFVVYCIIHPNGDHKHSELRGSRGEHLVLFVRTCFISNKKKKECKKYRLRDWLAKQTFLFIFVLTKHKKY